MDLSCKYNYFADGDLNRFLCQYRNAVAANATGLGDVLNMGIRSTTVHTIFCNTMEIFFSCSCVAKNCTSALN